MKKGDIATIASYTIWGLLPAFWKLLAVISPFYVLNIRVVTSFIFGLAILVIRGNTGELVEAFRCRDSRRRIIAAGIAIYFNWGIYIWAVNSGFIVETSMGYYFEPLLIIAAGMIIFGEKLDLMKKLAVLLAVIGVAIALAGYGSFPFIAFAVASTFCVYSIVKKNVVLSPVVSVTAEAAVMTVPAVIICLFFEFGGHGISAAGGGSLYWIASLAGIATAAPLMLFSLGAQSIPLSRVGIYQYVSPTISLLLGVFVYRETVTVADKVLFAFVWAGVAIYLISLARDGARRGASESPIGGNKNG